MEKEIILVNENDEKIGVNDKLSVHKNGELHRAFSIFIFNQDTKEFLLQKRAINKYHSGGLWSNACCSHPTNKETWENALNNRLNNELGIELNFKIAVYDTAVNCKNDRYIYYCGKFHYCSNVGNLVENEIDSVFTYITTEKSWLLDMDFRVNKEEVEEVKWVSVQKLDKWLKERPEDFTVWFYPAYKIVCDTLNIDDVQ